MIAYLSRGRYGILYILIASLLLRLVIACFTNFGIDEVYYVLYGLFPDWSYFDHPPMIALLIRLTTLDMQLWDELFLRLGPLIIGTINIYLLYYLGDLLKDRQTGIFAALLGCASVYASVITGVFILPDTPQSLFWLLSLIVFVRYIKSNAIKFIYLFGVLVGLTMLSKYHGVFLWVAAFLYFLNYKWKFIFNKHILAAGVISIVVFSPVILWNIFNDMSSLSFHGDRIGSGSWIPNFKNFFPELFGQLMYNNPLNVVLIIICLVYFRKNRDWAVSKEIAFMIYAGIPLPLLVLGMSMYNSTLPHWSGPAYYSLILVAAVYCSSILLKKPKKQVQLFVWGSNLFIASVLFIGMIQVYTGFIPMGKADAITKLGKNDPTVDLYAWDDIGDRLNKYTQKEIALGNLNKNFKVITHNWFPASHLDFYFALPHDISLYVIGNIKKQHIYRKINRERGMPAMGSDACYITTSLHYKELPGELREFYKQVDEQPEIITIVRAGKDVVNVFVWKCQYQTKSLELDK